MKTHLDKLIELATECSAIAGETADTTKRDLFARLAQHYNVLANEVERAARHGDKWETIPED